MMMVNKKVFAGLLLVSVFFISACVYIVLPEGVETTSQNTKSGDSVWTGIVTGVNETENGDLHVDVTIRNDTGLWSSMRAADGKPALLTMGDGTTTECETVFMSTGGHRLAPGFQIRGYSYEDEGQQEIQLLYVECPGVGVSPGSTLEIDYYHFDGEVDYYIEIEEENRESGKIDLNLDEVVTDLVYPTDSPDEELIQEQDIQITALSENIIQLLDIQPTESGLIFTWQNQNPSRFALKTHIGIPPVVGDDGIIYGVYVTLDIPAVPLTPGEGSVDWNTEVTVPDDVNDLYILLSVESKKPRTYSNYLLKIDGR